MIVSRLPRLHREIYQADPSFSLFPSTLYFFSPSLFSFSLPFPSSVTVLLLCFHSFPASPFVPTFFPLSRFSFNVSRNFLNSSRTIDYREITHRLCSPFRFKLFLHCLTSLDKATRGTSRATDLFISRLTREMIFGLLALSCSRADLNDVHLQISLSIRVIDYAFRFN